MGDEPRDRWEGLAREHNRKIERLERELAECRAAKGAAPAAVGDTARIDWLERNRMDLDFVTRGHKHPPGWRVWGPKDGDVPYGVHSVAHASVREAIDAAMTAHPVAAPGTSG